MGDKGGKKDKAKGLQQQIKKSAAQASQKQAKQVKRTP